ncbi:unnamed protein product [Lymnaea stagnalis]|uniref:G-protein coupled receptors family 1 profile domain-containing protein n=1 Tax=Lymnaea stagnalis TaxID=6523 RepID=A0AAV2IFF0_LYMST
MPGRFNKTSFGTYPATLPLDSKLTGEEFLAWRQAKVLDLAPVIVLDVLFMLFGVVGNSIVCYVCYFRMPRNVINSFVLSLAVLELLGCIFTIPVDITELLNSYNFNFPSLCKAERYFRKFLIFSTGCILVAIATERYKRIVKPYSRHVTMFEFRCAISGALMVSGIMAVPEAVLSGNETVHTPYGKGVVCSTYNTDAYGETIFPKLWGLMCLLVYVVSTAAIATIYFVIASKIWKRGKVPTDRRSRPNTPDSTLQRRVRYPPQNSTSRTLKDPSFNVKDLEKSRVQQRHSMASTVTTHPTDLSAKLQNFTKLEPNAKPFLEHSLKSTSCLDPEKQPDVFNSSTAPYRFSVVIDDHSNSHELLRETADLLRGPESQKRRAFHRDRPGIHPNKQRSTLFVEELIRSLSQRTSNNQKPRRHYNPQESPDVVHNHQSLTPVGSLRRNPSYSRKRTTFIMFVMTLTTAISHLPHITVMLYKLSHPGSNNNLQPDMSVVFRIVWNSFFISLATHPFVYGFWNGRFKHALYALFTGISRKRTRREHRESCSSGRQS